MDRIDHMANWNEKRALSIMPRLLLLLPVVNPLPGFVLIKLETVSKVITDVRRMLEMLETKPTLFKVNRRNTRTSGVKYV